VKLSGVHAAARTLPVAIDDLAAAICHWRPMTAVLDASPSTLADRSDARNIRECGGRPRVKLLLMRLSPVREKVRLHIKVEIAGIIHHCRHTRRTDVTAESAICEFTSIRRGYFNVLFEMIVEILRHTVQQLQMRRMLSSWPAQIPRSGAVAQFSLPPCRQA
jgi:hypothetical protein